MQIEPIDLRLPQKVPAWLWYLNGLLFALLIALVLFPNLWRGEATDEGDTLKASAPAAVPIPAAVSSHASAITEGPKALDWDAVLTGLEKNQTEGIVMEGFTIDAVSRTMRLTLSFDTYEHLALYIGSPHWEATQLTCRLDNADFPVDASSIESGRATINCE